MNNKEQKQLAKLSGPIRSQEISKSTSIDILALNGDCMRKIFDYCSLPDLFNMCIASEELKTTILQNGIRGRVIKFSELADSCHILDVFKTFGQQMSRINIGEKDIQYKERKYSKFDEILRLISTYCSIDTLKHLNLQYYNKTVIKKRFLYASIPFFRCIESLTISETDHHGSEECINYFENNAENNPTINDFVERIVGHAINIHTIELHKLKISGRFFYLQHVRNLKTLLLDGCNIRVPEGFLSYIQENPKLKSFTWENSSMCGMDTHISHSSNSVYEFVVNNMPDLEAFHYYPNEGFINAKNKYDADFLFKLPDYQLLAKFSQLKVLSIPGITVECLNLLAQKNTLETLLTGFSNVIGNSFDLNFLNSFTSLKCIQLFIPIAANVNSFNKELLTKLPNLTDCQLDFIHIEDSVISKAVESAKNLSTLKISSRRGLFTIALYSKLLQIRLERGLLEKPLVIYIEKKLQTQFLSRSGQMYRPNVIRICASI